MMEKNDKTGPGRPKSSSPERKKELARQRKAKQQRRDRAAREIGKRLKGMDTYERIHWLELLAFVFNGAESNTYDVIFLPKGAARDDFDSRRTNSQGVLDMLLGDEEVLQLLD